MSNSTLKIDLLRKLEEVIQSKIEELKLSIASAKESRDNDTKSSAGDKYETGREMMQMEINKASAQLAKHQLSLHELDKIGNEVTEELKEVKKRVTILERWKWWVMGGSWAIGFIIATILQMGGIIKIFSG